MAECFPCKLAVILPADVADSTALVLRDGCRSSRAIYPARATERKDIDPARPSDWLRVVPHHLPDVGPVSLL